jgi:toxin FitB
VIVLDTNVLSELMRAQPAASVMAWFTARPVASLFTTTITQAEILYGIGLVSLGRRRSRLEESARQMFGTDFADRILPFDSSAAEAYAAIAAARQRSGRPIAQFDAQIAAIARSRDADVATRNVADFEGCGLRVLDPWAS